MMRTGFSGYDPVRALAKVRKPAMTAGATRSLAAQRRFKRTDGASPGRSSICGKAYDRFRKDGRRHPGACRQPWRTLSIGLPAPADSWIVTRQKYRDNSLGLTFRK